MDIENNSYKGNQISSSQILDYWYQLEFYNPCWPVKPQDIDLSKNATPWLQPQSNPKIRASYDVYVGKAFSRNLIQWMLKKLNLQAKNNHVERDTSKSCLFALKVDETGKYVVGSFTLSSFVWAICQLVSAGEFNKKLSMAELDMLQQDLDNRLSQAYTGEEAPQISKNSLTTLYSSVCTTLKIKDHLHTSALWARKKIQYANQKGEFPPLDPSTELLPSFLLNDILKIQKSPTQKINTYIQAMLEKKHSEMQCIQIDTDVEQMQRWLSADSFPLGVWPSPYTPSLMQQLGINLAISNEQNIFSINGPPGTGKTTLVKEIVVSNVIQRAILMSEYDDPEKAFKKDVFKNPPDQYSKTFYKLDKNLSAYGMIVASHGNTAVENISKELPRSIEKDRTGRFSRTGPCAIEDTYFADIATQYMNEPAWGLISARLGKKENLKELKTHLWTGKRGADNNVTLKQYFDEAAKGKRPDWQSARQKFATALQAVYDAQKDIACAQTLLVEENNARTVKMDAQVKVDKASVEHSREKETLEAQKEALTKLEKKLALQRQNIETLQSSLSFWKRILWRLFKNNSVIKEWLKTQQNADETIIQITRQRTLCQTQKDAVDKAGTRLKSAEHDLRLANQRLQDICESIIPYKSLFGRNWADIFFWENITENESSQIACPWTHAEYDKLREELFYQALMLHKAFVLSSNSVKQNLKRLFSMWDGNFIKSDCQAAYGDLLNTLLLVIPVVSTTFSSVQTFLEDVAAEELGFLIVDEAGQATPQSALGAIWRTRKAIVVGDPLQIEPIVTIPKELSKRFADENNIPPDYRIPELSVQSLADQLNPYGGFRDINGESVWLGCPLIVHRRCLYPMFQISNNVAYNGRMFNQTEAPAPEIKFLLEQSAWFDIKGAEKGDSNHTVPQQIRFVANLVRQSLDVYEGLPDLYIITPFTTVDWALKAAIRPIIKNTLPQTDAEDITDWISKHCGTIHTFQGKEANEVLLVLGCDAQSGEGAMRWVGKKPNIINVAVSRARYRLGIIGDYDIWRDIPHVQEICKYLEFQR
ncbi:DEAD/DEAH box helicase [Desulfitobacterium hafniense]|uniref:DEAD/DEAH box helicase n=1 Tax=Desulfitobacterium hafniense TaxID=49338 RepID=UPI0003762DA0|nr:AAA domain-containing protein [Desulfitobacterium hafniense]